MLKAQNLDVAVSALLALFGAYVAYQGAAYGYLDGNNPAAGFFPVWIGLGMALFSSINLVKAIRRSGIAANIELAEVLRVGLCSAAMAAFVWLGSVIGMIASAFLLMVAIGVIFGQRTGRFYAELAALSAVMTAVLYLVFGVVLAVPLM